MKFNIGQGGEYTVDLVDGEFKLMWKEPDRLVSEEDSWEALIRDISMEVGWARSFFAGLEEMSEDPLYRPFLTEIQLRFSLEAL